MESAPEEYHVGQPVVYTIPKNSERLGSRAKDLPPPEHGETDTGYIGKYWSIDEVRGDGRLVLRTESGKTHVVQSDDPGLRIATAWERFWFRRHFPQPIVP